MNEDPENQRQSRESLSDPLDSTSRFDFEFYGSGRVHVINAFDAESGESTPEVADGLSRVGLRTEWEIGEGRYLFARGELGFDLVNQFTTRAGNYDENSLDGRLYYFGLEVPGLHLLYGKNWSSYYKIAGMTDRFAIFGGSASGVYNAGTAGEKTGTGRAEEVIQGRVNVDLLKELLHLKPFNLNFQYQQGQEIPQVTGESYEYGYGLSAWLEHESEYGIGIAYNFSKVKDRFSTCVKVRENFIERISD